MTGKEAIKILVLGEYSQKDINDAFNELVAEGILPPDSETDRAEEVFNRMPFCYEGSWKGLPAHIPTLEDRQNSEQT